MKKQSQDKKVIYQARFVRENFGDRFKVKPNQILIKEWTLRNNGETEWPEDTLFIQTNGDEMRATSQIVPGPVKPNQEVTIRMELESPILPGKYCSFFRLVYGDNQRFGQKVWCDILVEKDDNQMIGSRMVPQNVSIYSEPKEEKSSLLSEHESQEISNPAKEPLVFEDLADQYERLQNNVFQPAPAQEINEKEQLKQSINKFIGDGLDDHVEALNESLVEDEVEQLQQQMSSPSQNQISVAVQPEEEKQSQLQKSELSQDEKDKLAYLQDMDNSQIKDSSIIENLKYMLDMGYTNFTVNYQLLKRNNNDLTIALNLLCNNMVTDSIFNQ